MIDGMMNRIRVYPALICAIASLSLAALAGAEDSGLAIERGGLMKHVEFLASAEMRGRAMASPEEKKAAEYIARELSEAGLAPPKGWESPIQVIKLDEQRTAHNVVFALPGSHPDRSDEWIVLGAHLDHLGVRNGKVYHGADDNASGVAGIIEIAKAMRKRERKLDRSLLFCFFTGEERGLVGSRHLMKHLPIPKQKIIVMLNADMIGRDDARTIHIVGTQTAESLKGLVETANKRVGLKLVYDHAEWTFEGDHYVFFKESIPFLYFGVEDHRDYHKPTDTADKIVREEIEAVSRLIYYTAELLAGGEAEPPEWIPNAIRMRRKP